MSDHYHSRPASMKTCPICGLQAYAAVRRCKGGCGWNFSEKRLEGGDGTAVPLQTGVPVMPGLLSPTAPTAAPRAAPAAAAAIGASGALPLEQRSRRRAAAGEVSSSVRTLGRVVSHSGVDPEDDGNMDVCIMCGDMGMLLCCDICPLSYHADCAGLETVPSGFWACPECTAKNLGAEAAAAKAGTGGAGAAAGSAGGVGGAGARASPSAPATPLGVGVLQGGLDSFHARLNACLEHDDVQEVRLDGLLFQCFRAADLSLMDPAKLAAHKEKLERERAAKAAQEEKEREEKERAAKSQQDSAMQDAAPEVPPQTSAEEAPAANASDAQTGDTAMSTFA